MSNNINLEALYKQRDEIRIKYMSNQDLYRADYDKTLKRIRYWTDEAFRTKKNNDDLERYKNRIKTDEFREHNREYHRQYQQKLREKQQIITAN